MTPDLIRGLDARVIAHNLQVIRERVGDTVQILAAVKYVAAEELGVLAEAGVTLVGENRAQALVQKQAAHPGLFTWDFIGHLQSRKVREIVPLTRLIHSVASESALAQVARHGSPATRVLVEVDVAGESGKSGVRPDALADLLERAGAAGVIVTGLMTMPPLVADPEDSRRWFAALAALAADHDLRELSMGTSQDYAVAAQEGATIIRVGSGLYR